MYIHNNYKQIQMVTLVSSSQVPAEDYWRSRPADGGGVGVHLQLRERRPAQPVLRHPGVSAAEGLRVRQMHTQLYKRNTAGHTFSCSSNASADLHPGCLNCNVGTLKQFIAVLSTRI